MKILFRMKFPWTYRFLLFSVAVMLLSFAVPGKRKKKLAQRYQVASVVKHRSVDVVENPYYIIIDKKDYELKVYDADGWYATYPIVFGSRDLEDKMKEGDKRTPDGNFHVVLKKIHPDWGPELLLDYPNEESYQKFNARKAKGLLTRNARIGGGIAIHATRPEEEWTVDNYYNWTDGCVSVKYREMKDLYSYIPVGTPVTIRQ